uniref:Uncharacterized protein n=1 Tax=Arundo donax TaxID=35708 RepID=A0A0A9HQ06_ARUDO
MQDMASLKKSIGRSQVYLTPSNMARNCQNCCFNVLERSENY